MFKESLLCEKTYFNDLLFQYQQDQINDLFNLNSFDKCLEFEKNKKNGETPFTKNIKF